MGRAGIHDNPFRSFSIQCETMVGIAMRAYVLSKRPSMQVGQDAHHERYLRPSNLSDLMLPNNQRASAFRASHLDHHPMACVLNRRPSLDRKTKRKQYTHQHHRERNAQRPVSYGGFHERSLMQTKGRLPSSRGQRLAPASTVPLYSGNEIASSDKHNGSKPMRSSSGS